jgi:hypothetical protein
MIPADKLDLVKKFAAARPSACQRNLGPDHKFKEVWWPRLAGRHVRNSDTPETGYPDRAAATLAANQYRESCRKALANQ